MDIASVSLVPYLLKKNMIFFDVGGVDDLWAIGKKTISDIVVVLFVCRLCWFSARIEV